MKYFIMGREDIAYWAEERHATFLYQFTASSDQGRSLPLER